MRLLRSGWGVALALCGLLATTALRSEEPFSTTVGAVTVGDVKKMDAYDVPYLTWGGDVATFLANGGNKATKPETLFAKQGLKVNLVPGDDFVAQVKSYLEGKTPFLRGTMSQLGQASEVLGKDSRTTPVVFLQLTWSAGDHLVAREAIKSVNDLKGKKIALQKGGPHVGMLDDILRLAKLSWKDIQVVWTDDVTGPKGPAALLRKDNTIAACFAISPDMIGLTGGLDKIGPGTDETIKGARVLVSTVQLSRSIADVYACRKDFFDKNKEMFEKFTAAYLKASEELVDLKNNYDAKEKDKDQLAKYKAILKQTQEIYTKEVIPDLADAHGLISDATFVGLPGNYFFFTNTKDSASFQGRMNAALDLAVGQGYATARVPLLNANFDYKKIRSLGELKQEIPKEEAAEEKFSNVPIPLDDDKNTIASFTIQFEANSPDFDKKKYEKDFQDAVENARLYGQALVAVRGHVDPTKTLKEFVTVAMEKGFIRRIKEGSEFKYFLVKDGSPLDLNDTKKVMALIEKENLVGTDDNPKLTMMAALDLSQKRAKVIRDAIVEYAKDKGLRLDESQIKFVGVGIAEPVIPKPKNEEQAAKNRRVEFRIIKVSPELVKKKDFEL